MKDISNLVEVTLKEQDDFLKVRETLTRIGVASRRDKILYQSCHILHKQGKYYIVHFKELFDLDGKPTDITENDLARRNAIINLLEDWGLVSIVNKEATKIPEPIFLSQVKIISHKEKSQWQLVPKYQIGNKSKNN
jgi:Bacteriophage translational regulator